MSWHYLQEPEGESSEAICLGGEPWRPSKLKNIPEPFYCRGNLTDTYLDSLSGTMFAPSTENRGENELTLLPEDSLARTSALQETRSGTVKESTENGLGYGLKCLGLLGRLCPDTFLWKTLQPSLFQDSEELLATFPRWGMTRNGELLELIPPEPPTSEKESGYWPTPLRSDATRGPTTAERNQKRLGGISLVSAVKHWQSPAERQRDQPLDGGSLNPDWVEWLMGWPIGWTGLRPLETDRFQQWSKSPWKSWEGD